MLSHKFEFKYSSSCMFKPELKILNSENPPAKTISSGPLNLYRRPIRNGPSPKPIRFPNFLGHEDVNCSWFFVIFGCILANDFALDIWRLYPRQRRLDRLLAAQKTSFCWWVSIPLKWCDKRRAWRAFKKPFFFILFIPFQHAWNLQAVIWLVVQTSRKSLTVIIYSIPHPKYIQIWWFQNMFQTTSHFLNSNLLTSSLSFVAGANAQPRHGRSQGLLQFCGDDDLPTGGIHCTAPVQGMF